MVHVLRPKTSTSGGQSDSAWAEVVPSIAVEEEEDFFGVLVIAIHEATEVQERHLAVGSAECLYFCLNTI